MLSNHQSQIDKKDRIIKAAARVFAQKGYAGAAVADIAVQAEIGKGTIYAYFDSKEDLFFAVFEWFKMQTGVAAKVNITHLGGSASKRLEALSDSIMGMWDEIRCAFTLTILKVAIRGLSDEDKLGHGCPRITQIKNNWMVSVDKQPTISN
jgi:AcrR family transcriptional regulator